MRLYIDKENMISFLASKQKKGFRFCRQMMVNQLDLFFNFTKKEAREIEGFDTIAYELADGVANRDICYLKEGEQKYPIRPLKVTCANEFDRQSLMSVFLLADEKAVTIKERQEIMISQCGTEVDLLNRLYFEDCQYEDRDLVKNINQWSQFEQYVLPSTDIILIDQYILSDDSIYKYNVYPLLKILASPTPDKKINIVVITKKEHFNPQTKHTFVPDWNGISAQIKLNLKKKHAVINVTFVLLPSWMKDQKTEEHDRTILTNYRRYYSGDSFNYVSSTGKIISAGREWEVSSLARKKNHNLAIQLLEDIQYRIDEMKKLNNPDLIIGDKESCFLSFW